MLDKLKQLKEGLDKVYKAQGLREPESKVFSNVSGYPVPKEGSGESLTPLQAAYNLWAIFNYVFDESLYSSWTHALKLAQITTNGTAIYFGLFGAAHTLLSTGNNNPIATDENVALLSVYRSFFQSLVDDEEIDKFPWAIKKAMQQVFGEDIAKAFMLLAELINIANAHYQLAKLADQIQGSGVIDLGALNQFRKSAIALLPVEQQKKFSEQTTIDAQFADHYIAAWVNYTDEVKQLAEGLPPILSGFVRKLDNEITEVTDIHAVRVVGPLGVRFIQLTEPVVSQQDVEMPGEPTESIDLVDEAALYVEEIPVPADMSIDSSHPVPLPHLAEIEAHILELDKEMAELGASLTALEARNSALAEQQANLASERLKSPHPDPEFVDFVRESHAECVAWQTMLLADEFTLPQEEKQLGRLYRVLDADQQILEDYVAKQAAKNGWVAWGWNLASNMASRWIVGNANSLSYEDQKEVFNQSLTKAIHDKSDKLEQCQKEVEAYQANLAQSKNLTQQQADLDQSISQKQAEKKKYLDAREEALQRKANALKEAAALREAQEKEEADALVDFMAVFVNPPEAEVVVLRDETSVTVSVAEIEAAAVLPLAELSPLVAAVDPAVGELERLRLACNDAKATLINLLLMDDNLSPQPTDQQNANQIQLLVFFTAFFAFIEAWLAYKQASLEQSIDEIKNKLELTDYQNCFFKVERDTKFIELEPVQNFTSSGIDHTP